MIAALFVQKGGSYFGHEAIDPWDEARDARRYEGPHPVIAHPPCSRWCRLAGLVEARWGHRRGDDGGCFASALAAVRRFGGVLEHPAWSLAWPAFDLPEPRIEGGWATNLWGGWSCHVEQGRYGHRAKKATWLHVCGVAPVDLPDLRWGSTPDQSAAALVSWCANRIAGDEKRPRLTKREASKTTPEFREVLVDLARKAGKNAVS